jgi:hypothetical protein
LFNVDLARDIICHSIVCLILCFELSPSPVSLSPRLVEGEAPNLLKLLHYSRCVGDALLVCIVEAFCKNLIDDLIFA